MITVYASNGATMGVLWPKDHSHDADLRVSGFTLQSVFPAVKRPDYGKGTPYKRAGRVLWDDTARRQA